MKLLFFIHSLGAGGAERVTSIMANHWSGKGWPVTVLTMTAASTDFFKLHPAVERISLGLDSEGGNVPIALWNNARRIWALRGVLKRVKPDVVLSLMPISNVLLVFAAFGITNIATIGCERAYPSFAIGPATFWARLRRWTYSKLTVVAVQTNDAKTWLLSNTRARHVAVIPNPVLWPLQACAPEPSSSNKYSTNGKRVLLAVGRLEEEKGLPRLVDAFAALAPNHPDWMLVIVGEGSQRKTLEAQISQRGIETKVLLPGVDRDVARWYKSADLYALSSRFEGFPNTLVEALAHELPAVSFDCDAGPRDIIRNGIDGLLVAAGDLPALTAALDRLMTDERLRRGFAKHAGEARARFSMERIAGMWETLFGEITSPGKS